MKYIKLLKHWNSVFCRFFCPLCYGKSIIHSARTHTQTKKKKKRRYSPHPLPPKHPTWFSACSRKISSICPSYCLHGKMLHKTTENWQAWKTGSFSVLWWNPCCCTSVPMCISIFNYQNTVNGEKGGKQESGCVQEAKEFVNFFNKLDKYIKSFFGKELFLEFFWVFFFFFKDKFLEIY